jgi:methionyl-tRNA formyltransferase
MPLRIVFFGTAELACASLEALARNAEFQIVAVVTQPDKPRGRDLQLQPTAVKATALKLHLAVLQPKRARDLDFIEQIRALTPELGVVVAYGQILPQSLLDVPRHGCLNVHTSLLPRHRGAAPIQWAILSGDQESGVTIMKMDAGLDTGPILRQRSTPIASDETAQSLHDRLAVMGAELLIETSRGYVRGQISPRPQPEGATYARKIEKTDGQIDWKDSASKIERKIRAFTPWPGAFTTLEISGKARAVKIWRAEVEPISGTPGTVVGSDRAGLVIATSDNSLRILELQVEGRRRMSVQEFLAGHSVTKVLPFA